MQRRSVSNSFSVDVVEYLLQRGMSLADIASTLGVTKSFVSRVKSRQRNLTVDHLLILERILGKPLPLLLIEATPKTEVPAHLRPLYEATKAVIRSGYRLRKQLAVPPKRTRAKAVSGSRRRRAG